MATSKNSISALNELAQSRGAQVKFNVLYSFGPSHQPRFLCQWKYNGQIFPAVFAKSKQEGKNLSAAIALECVRLASDQHRELVIFQTDTVPPTKVIKSTVENLDIPPHMLSPVAELRNMVLDNQDVPPVQLGPTSISSANSPIQQQTADTPKPAPRKMAIPSVGALAPPPRRIMKAFDKETIAALAMRPQIPTLEPAVQGAALNISPTFTSPAVVSIVAAPPSGVKPSAIPPIDTTKPKDARPPGVPSVINQMEVDGQLRTPTTAVDSLDLSSTLAPSLKYEEQPVLMEKPTTMGSSMPHSDDVVMAQASGKNAISKLYELGQRSGVQPNFQVLGRTGPDNLPMFQMQCTYGSECAIVLAGNKREGKLKAFEEVLAKLERLDLHSRRDNIVESGSTAASPRYVAAAEDVAAGGNAAAGGNVAAGGEPCRPNGQSAISAVNELGNKLSIVPRYECEQISGPENPRFRGYCYFGDRTFEPAEGRNKKETKNAVFTKALQLLEADPTIKAAILRKQYRINSGASTELAATPTSPVAGASLSQEDVQMVLSQKHPISSFMEYGQARRMKPVIVEVKVDGPSHCRSFTYKCMLDEKSYPEATASTVKDAKKNAAELALRCLSSSSLSSINKTQNKSHNASHRPAPPSMSMRPQAAPATASDTIADCVLSQFNAVKGQCGADLGKIVLAGFVIENTSSGKFTVVSIGTGNKCINGQSLSMDGTVVNDCHAEVIARRGLLRFFYHHLNQHKMDPTKTIFQPTSGDSSKVQLRANLKLHLYISTAPCGDGAVFSHNDSNSDLSDYSLDDAHLPTIEVTSHGQLRTKMESGEGTIPTPKTEEEAMQTFDGITRGGRLRTMSCSDKICKWNILGVQGTLLSQLMYPVYMNSLVLGQLFNPGHLCRALCCRVKSFDEFLNTNQGPFKVNHIRIDRSGVELKRSIARSKPLSLNWVKGDQHSELLDGETGQIISLQDNNRQPPVSRLSRKHLYSLYLALTANTSDVNTVPYYHGAKAAVTEYKEVKDELYREFARRNYGHWVRKPEEQNMFR